MNIIWMTDSINDVISQLMAIKEAVEISAASRWSHGRDRSLTKGLLKMSILITGFWSWAAVLSDER